MKEVNLSPSIDAVTNDTPWLDDEEMRIWRGFVQATGRISTLLSDSLKTATGLTLDDYEVLVHLSEADDQRLRMSDLSHRLSHSQSRATQRVDRLVKRGLVYREKCPEDRRGTFACMTPDGMALITEIAPGHLRDVRRHLIDLIEPDERAVMANVLQRIAVAAQDASCS